jgi:deoxycytidine triphosphate deaminase
MYYVEDNIHEETDEETDEEDNHYFGKRFNVDENEKDIPVLIDENGNVVYDNSRKYTNITYNGKNTAFYIHPRSSISKTPLMLANQTGVVDNGYRNVLIGAFRALYNTPYTLEKHTRLLQICHPSLCPVYVFLVNENELSCSNRGGFGSTGIVGAI